MALEQEIRSDALQAMKGKEELRSSVLRLLISALEDKEREKRYKQGQEAGSLSDEEVLIAVSYEAKKRKEAIIGFEKGGRTEAAEKEKKELEILQKYLPEQLTVMK